MIEEVKKILDSVTTSRQYGYITAEDKEKAAQQICQLFEPKPDEGRLLTERDLPWLYNFEAVKGNVDTVLEMQDTKTASIKDNDNILLLQYAEEKYPELLTDANWVNIKQSRWSQWQLDKVKESVNVTAIIKDAEWHAEYVKWIQIHEDAMAKKDAECQERVKRIFTEVEKITLRTETHYDPRGNTGTPDSTGGVINIGKDYLVVDKDKLQALKKKELK